MRLRLFFTVVVRRFQCFRKYTERACDTLLLCHDPHLSKRQDTQGIGSEYACYFGIVFPVSGTYLHDTLKEWYDCSLQFEQGKEDCES